MVIMYLHALVKWYEVFKLLSATGFLAVIRKIAALHTDSPLLRKLVDCRAG